MAAALDAPGLAAALGRADQHERPRAQVLEALGDGDRAVGELLDVDVGAEPGFREPPDGDPPEV